MDRRLLIVAGGGIAVGLLAVLIMGMPTGPSIDQYPMTLQVTDGNNTTTRLGVSVDPGVIAFGRIPTTTVRASRRITVTNNQDRSVRVRLRATGNITLFLTRSTTAFSLEPGINRTVTLTVETANDADPGYYAGELYVEKR